MRTFEEILESDYHVQLEDNRRDESMKLAAAKFHSQFSQVGAEEAFEKRYEENNILPYDSDTIIDRLQKKAFLAAYSGEGFRVKEVKACDVKDGEEIWRNDKWIKISNPFGKWHYGEGDKAFLVRIPAPPKEYSMK